MSLKSKFLFLCCAIVVQFEMNIFETIDKHIETDQSDNYTFLIQAGYRPQHSEFAKFVVSLQVNKERKFFGDNHNCGGSILSAKTILTAAHCVTYDGKEEPVDLKINTLQIVAGAINLSERKSTTRVHKVQQILVYPGYDAAIPVGDVALLILTEAIDLDRKSRSVIELIDERPPPGTTCVALGWGRIFFGGPSTTILTYVNLTVLGPGSCIYDGIPILCVGSEQNYEAGVSLGDSGSPLICNGTLAGVASFGIIQPLIFDNYAPTQNFYVNINEYSDWILGSLENGAAFKNFHCVKITLALYFLIFFINCF